MATSTDKNVTDDAENADDENNEEKEDLLEDKCDLESKELRKVQKKEVRKEKKLNKRIDDITDSIWRQAKYTDGVLMMSIVYLAVVTSLDGTSVKTVADADNLTEYSMYPLFRTMKCVKNKSSHDCCMIFVDDHARVYGNWKDFKNSTMLPDSLVVAPTNGIYNCDSKGNVILEMFHTPASSVEFKIVASIDKVADIIGIISAVAALVAIGLIAWVPLAASIAVTIFTVASLVSAVASAWSAIRSATRLIDRKRHERPNTLNDAEARSCWLGAVGGATGLGAGLAGTGMSELIRNGQKIPTIMRCAVDAIAIANIIMQKLSLVNDYFDVMFRVKDRNVSALDFVRLAASLAVFIHSVNNFKVAKAVIKSHQQTTISTFREILSADQQKAFDRMARETIRVRGEFVGKADIIRSLRNNPLMRENIDSRIQMNNLIRQQNWKDTSAHTANILKNLKASLDNDDLVATVVNIREKTSERSFEMFRDLVTAYVDIHGSRIEHELNRFIPVEEFMSSIFSVLCIEALKNEQSVDEYILDTKLSDRQYLFWQINKFYAKYRMHPPNVVCNQCGGKYFNEQFM